jgi:ComF family protein
VRAVSFGPYSGRMRDAIHALKYDRLTPAAGRLGRMLAHVIGQLEPDSPAGFLVVPVPLHRSKSSHRGFNQARLLAMGALAVLRASHPSWRVRLAGTTVVRQRATESQAGLTPRQRRLNVRGAFTVPNPSDVAGTNVLVIDDIMTTGATARAVAQALLRAGAANVWVATLARAVHEKGSRPAGPFDPQKDLLSERAYAGLAQESAAGPDRESSQPSF